MDGPLVSIYIGKRIASQGMQLQTNLALFLFNLKFSDTKCDFD